MGQAGRSTELFVTAPEGRSFVTHVLLLVAVGISPTRALPREAKSDLRDAEIQAMNAIFFYSARLCAAW